MNAKTPDYGEPWNVGRIDRPTEDRHGHDPLMLHSTASRAVLCVNACAGMTDPAAEIQAMRDAIKDAHEALETAQRQWSHYAEFRDDEDLETAKHLEGDLYRTGQAALAKLKPFTTP